MKSTSKVIIVVLAFLAMAASTYAQSPREQLQQMVEQLQKTPNDNALRERIIKLGAEIKPAPAIPEEARRPFVRANTALKDAKTEAEYARAIDLYREALAIASWWGDAYYNLAKAQELRGDFREAMESLKLFILTAPPATDTRQAQDQIYALEERLGRKTAEAKANLEKVRSPEVEAARWAVLQKEKDEALLNSLDGAVFVYRNENSSDPENVQDVELHFRGREVTCIERIIASSRQRRERGSYVGKATGMGKGQVTRRVFTIDQSEWRWGVQKFEIASDAQTIRGWIGGDTVFKRR